MAAKSKRKFRYVFVSRVTGKFVRAESKNAKRRRIAIARPSKVIRSEKTGRFVSAGTPGAKTHFFVGVKPKRLFSRKIKLKTQPKKVEEVVYEIPFTLERAKVNGKSARVFNPSFPAIKSVFDSEAQIQAKNHNRFFHTAVCKTYVIFKDKEDSWIQIPIGHRIPVDEPDGADVMYLELQKFLLQYNIFAINVIQLSILRLPT